MKNLAKNPVVSKVSCKAKKICKNLSDIKIKNDYDVTVSIYDAKAPEKTESKHNMKGSCDCSLLKLLSVVGIVSITLSAICCVCSFFKD